MEAGLHDMSPMGQRNEWAAGTLAPSPHALVLALTIAVVVAHFTAVSRIGAAMLMAAFLFLGPPMPIKQALALITAIVRGIRFAIAIAGMATRLVFYSAILAPEFARIAWAYIRDKRILKSVRFGGKPRNFVDIYIPAGVDLETEKVPVVVAFMGGAWVLGHRAWNAPLGLRLADCGVLVVAADYRNFPFANVQDMVEDAHAAVDWVFANVATYGGDVNNVAILGQSAGAHLSSMVLLRRALAEAQGAAAEPQRPPPGWSVADLKGYLGVSGPYDLVALEPHLESRGLCSFLPSMCAHQSLAECSPARLLRAAGPALAARAVERLPPVHLLHGEEDQMVPATGSRDFADSLRSAGACTVFAELRPGVSHTRPIVEGPMQGEDPQAELVLRMLLGTEGAAARLQASPGRMPVMPSFAFSLAEAVCPF